jgi:alpha-amylase
MRLQKHAKSRALCFTLIVAGFFAASPALAGIMIQGFYHEPKTANRSWWRHLIDLAPSLRTAGVTAIWIPSPCKGASGGFSSGYDPYDLYDLGSKDQMSVVNTRFGSKEELLAFIGICHRMGLDVYSDIVVNHRGGGQQGGYAYDPKGSEGPGRLPMSPRDFHHGGYGDWHKEVGGGRDLKQEEPYVRDGLFRWIRWFDNQTGVDGYRIDAAKHMDPSFIEGLLYHAQEGNYKSRKKRFAVSEFFDGNPAVLGNYIDRTRRRTAVFDFGLRYNIKDVVHGNGYEDIRSVLFHLKDYDLSVPFINNHDTFQRGNGDDIYWRGNLAYCMILTQPGYPCVYYLDMLDSRGWVRPYLRTLMWVNTFLAHGKMITRWADGDLLINERQGNLITGMNDNSHSWRTAWVKTDFGGHVRLHDYSGSGQDKWTNQHGWVEINVPPNGYVNYGRAFQGNSPNPGARRTFQEYEGASDMDIRAAGEWWGKPIRFVAEKGQPIYIDLHLSEKSVEGHIALFDDKGKLLNHVKGNKGHVYTSFYNPPKNGWYQVRVGLTQSGQNKRSNFHLKTSYMAPWGFPGNYPAHNNTDPHLPPLK